MSKDTLPYPFNIELEQFLAGEHSEDCEIDVDNIFAKDFNRVLSEMSSYDPASIAIDDTKSIYPGEIAKGYQFIEVDAGLLALDSEGHRVGGYLSCDLSVDEDHQGCGIGKELIIRRAVMMSGLPTWDLDIAAYSTEGLIAHESAWEYAQNNPDVIKSIVQEYEYKNESKLKL